MGYLLLLILVAIILEIKFSPRIGIVNQEFYTIFVVFYSIKTKYGSIGREMFELFKIKK